MDKTYIFINKSKKVHYDKYDYSLAVYINSKTKLKIICPQHGEYEQSPDNHIMGKGCSKCGHIKNIEGQRKTSEQFIKDALKIHGDKYDYSCVDYKDRKTKIKIKCTIHGIFDQNPMDHLRGNGCRKCAHMIMATKRRKPNDTFMNEVINVHNNTYDYNLVEYINNYTKIKIICAYHGIFEQYPNVHLNGSGCPTCAHEKSADEQRKTKEQFINDSVKKHGNKYDYSLIEYVNGQTKIKIKCPIHGIFEQTPHNHLHNDGCLHCGRITKIKHCTKTTEKFIMEAKEKHGDIYDYSLVDYKHSLERIKIICKRHGVFEQIAHCHLQEAGCRQCYIEEKTKTTEQFIIEAKAIHGNKYDYLLVNYTGCDANVIIICEKHGQFDQRPQGHLNGAGCPSCSHAGFSKQQIEWLTYIEKRDNIKIQHALNGSEFKVGKYKVDGYCQETNTVYEYHGCRFHGCRKCFNHFDVNPITKITNGEMYINTLEKNVYIMNQGYILETIWEHDWKVIRKTI